MKATKTHALYIRGVSKQIKNALKKEAVKNGRSLSAELLVRLTHSLVIPYLKLEKETNS